MENQQQQIFKKIFTKSNRKCIACGNIGVPFGDVVNNLYHNDILAVEVSSFQLDKIINLKFPYQFC